MNRLSSSTSPYLLQHAGNPVDWYPWCDEAFETAKRDRKLVLVSIGYSACHWCHVMEHESFEDAATARIMNENFVCIKVDREERPDVDQVYMAAVQLLTGQGGWPLNCFALPDGRPVYGGTYFPRSRWQDVLLNLSDLYRNNRQKVLDYAEQITQGVGQQELIPSGKTDSSDPLEHIKSSVERWKSRFDMSEGGSGSAPKFPLPANLMFLMMFEHLFSDPAIESYVKLTLKKMALGGIYDHLGGGFARYSVDPYWKVPHFEKMLYDNAQLISLYSQAYRKYRDPLYLQVVNETIDFLVRDLSGGNGNFFSALDADSEGVEGKYYVWTEEELRLHLGGDADVFCSYYSVGGKGLWEHDQNILLRDSESQIILSEEADPVALQQLIDECKSRLLKVRYTRVPPGLDDKTLASWNGLMITALCDAYDASGNEDYLSLALRSARFIRQHMLSHDGRIWHSWKVESSVNGFLEDYAFTIQGFIRLYQCTFNREWLDLSRDLCLYALDHFSDSGSPFLFFNSSADPGLFIRKHELHDNVIPSSNSQMAFNLHMLGRYFENEYFKGKSKQMWNAVAPGVVSYGSAWSNWMALGLMLATKPHELVFCGKEALKERSAVADRYFPLVMIAGAEAEDGLPLTAHRVPREGTLVYECINHTCALPAASAEAFLSTLDRKEVL